MFYVYLSIYVLHFVIFLIFLIINIKQSKQSKQSKHLTQYFTILLSFICFLISCLNYSKFKLEIVLIFILFCFVILCNIVVKIIFPILGFLVIIVSLTILFVQKNKFQAPIVPHPLQNLPFSRQSRMTEAHLNTAIEHHRLRKEELERDLGGSQWEFEQKSDELKEDIDLVSKINKGKSKDLVAGYMRENMPGKKYESNIPGIIENYLFMFLDHGVYPAQKDLLLDWRDRFTRYGLFDRIKQKIENLSLCKHTDKKIYIDPQSEYAIDKIGDDDKEDAIISRCNKCDLTLLIDSRRAAQDDYFDDVFIEGIWSSTGLLESLPHDWLKHEIVAETKRILPDMKQMCECETGPQNDQKVLRFIHRKQGGRMGIFAAMMCGNCGLGKSYPLIADPDLHTVTRANIPPHVFQTERRINIV